MTLKRNGDLKHGLFWFPEWSMSDPNNEHLHEAMHCARYSLRKLTQNQAYLILRAAEDYCHLAGHPASTKYILDQLRTLRKAIKTQCKKEMECLK